MKRNLKKPPNFMKMMMLLILAFNCILLSNCSKETISTSDIEEQNNKPSDSEIVTKNNNIYADSSGDIAHGYFYSIDTYLDQGSAYINFDGVTNQNKGNFSMQWNGVKQIVGGKGWRSGSGRTVNYNVGYVSGYNDIKFIGVYGWTNVNQGYLTEYYVCEKGPGAIYNGQNVGGGGTTYYWTSNNKKYSLRKNFRNGEPSPEGFVSYFWQFESLLEDQQNYDIASNNEVKMGDHFWNWDRLINNGAEQNTQYPGTFGMQIDKGYMVFGVEAYNFSNNNGATGYINASVW